MVGEEHREAVGLDGHHRARSPLVVVDGGVDAELVRLGVRGRDGRGVDDVAPIACAAVLGRLDAEVLQQGTPAAADGLRVPAHDLDARGADAFLGRVAFPHGGHGVPRGGGGGRGDPVGTGLRQSARDELREDASDRTGRATALLGDVLRPQGDLASAEHVPHPGDVGAAAVSPREERPQ